MNLYASGAGNDAEAAFEINQTTGQLTQLPAPFNCLTLATSGCGVNDATGLKGARRVVVSPDGRNVYVAGQGSGSIAVLARNPVPPRATITAGDEASWDSNDPAGSVSATVTVTAVSCSANPAGAIAGQQEGIHLVGTLTHNGATSLPRESLEILSYCNGKTPTYGTEVEINEPASDSDSFAPTGLSVSAGDPLEMSITVNQSLQITDVNTGQSKSFSGPAFTAVNGFDVGMGAITSNGHGAPLISGSEPDASPFAVLPGPVPASPVVFANTIVGDPPLASAPALYQEHWIGTGNSTIATPSAITNGGNFAGDIASVAPPKTGSKADVALVKGTVLIKLPGTHKFVPLSSIKQIPNGTIINATHGSVQITIEEPNGTIETGVYFGGEFQLVLTRAGAAIAKLVGGSFKGCPKPAPKKPTKHKKKKKAPDAGAASFSRHHPVRHLWSNAHGSFSTQGKYGSAAVRGTEWLTQDQCNGTFFKVTRDEITVKSFKLHNQKTIVKQGHSFLSPA